MKNAIVALSCALVAACNASSAGVEGEGTVGCALSVEWGTGAGTYFAQMHDGDDVPVATDAQGTCFVDSSLRFSGTDAATATIDVTLTAEGYQPDEQPGRTVSLSPGSDGSLYAAGLRVPLDDLALPDMAGRRAVVMVVAHAGGCTAWTAATVCLR